MEVFGVQIPVWMLVAYATFCVAGLLLWFSQRRAGTIIPLNQGSRFARLTRRADVVMRISIALWWAAAALYHWIGGSQAYQFLDLLTLQVLAAIPLWALLRVLYRARFGTWDLWIDPWEAVAQPVAWRRPCSS
jgi:hypothetical protein